MPAALIRTFVMYIVVSLSMRLMGKRQIAELESGELVVTVIISELAAIPLQDSDAPLLYGIVPILMLIVLELIMSSAALKIPALRRIMSGRPVIVVNNGKLDIKAMNKIRFTVDDLMEQLRLLGIFRLSDCQYVICETSGKISVMKKPERCGVVCRDLNIEPEDSGIPAVVISDGKVFEDALKLCGSDRQTLTNILKKHGLSADKLFFMQLDKKGEYDIIRKED